MNAPSGWTPIRFFQQAGRHIVDWCDLRGMRFTAPFFDQTVSGALEHPYRLLIRHQTSPEALAAFAEHHPSLPPRGFVFHLSRCGSTLVAQMLAALPENVVISEASVIESILRAHLFDPTITEEQRLAWFRGMIGALGQRRHADERHLFVKFDSWQTLDLPLIRRAFPDVPWLFLYRDPVEVLVSQRRERGGRMIPAPVEAYLLGLDFLATIQMPVEEYHARILAAWCRAAIQEYGPQASLLDYRQLPDAFASIASQHFAVPYQAEKYERMRNIGRQHAKRPHLAFVSDTRAKQDAATHQERAMADRFVHPLYEQLEAMRKRAETARPVNS